MKPEDYSPVSVELSDCESGWIIMVLRAEGQEVKIRLSHVFDPIPDFICWLEALLTDVYQCGFEIEEEGPEKHFSSRRRLNSLLHLQISEPGREGTIVHLNAGVHRRQLIEAIYHGFQNFGNSSHYPFKEWESETLGEYLDQLTDKTIDEIKVFLVGLDPTWIRRFFHAICPGHLCGVPDEIKEYRSLDSILEFALRVDNAIVAESLSRSPDSWNFSIEVRVRETEIHSALANIVWPFHGTPLGSLRSETLENYLASDRDCDTL